VLKNHCHLVTTQLQLINIIIIIIIIIIRRGRKSLAPVNETVIFFSDYRQLVEQPQLLHGGPDRVCCAQLQEPHDYSSGGVLGVRLILFHSAATDGC
jgi:hypothetical protein